MLKIKIAFLLLTVLSWSEQIKSQSTRPEIIWQKCYGSYGSDIPVGIVKCPDGGFLLGGHVGAKGGDVITPFNPSPTANDIWVIKVDSVGNKVWQKCLGGGFDDRLMALIPATDGGYIGFGEVSSTIDNYPGSWKGRDIFVFKLDDDGTTLWSKAFGLAGEEFAGNIKPCADGGYIFTGGAGSFGIPGYNPGLDPDIWVLKIDKLGNQLWARCMGNQYYQKGLDLIELPNGNISLVGLYANSYDSPKAIRYTLDPFGSVLDSTFLTDTLTAAVRIGGTDNIEYARWGKRIQPSCNNRITDFSKFGISTFEPTECSGQSYVSIPSLNASKILSINPNLTYIVGGISDISPSIPSLGGMDAFFCEIDQFGNKKNLRLFGGSNSDEFVGIVQISPTEFMVLGRAKSNDFFVSGGHGDDDFWLTKIVISQKSNTIEGKLYLDNNSNGLPDTGEPLLKNVFVKSEKSGSVYGSISSQGQFLNIVDTGTYITSAVLTKPYYVLQPAFRQSVFNSYNNVDSFNLALQPIPGKKDLEISVVELTPARPGFTAGYQVYGRNVGTESINANIIFKKDNRQTFISATPMQSGISGDSLNWSLGTLQPDQEVSINVLVRQDTSLLHIGDTLALHAEITPIAGDETPVNNVFDIRQIARGSFDPNDKQERNGGFFTTQQLAAGEDFTYTIRFQNTGTDTAFNIVVRDTLDAKLDPSSISLVGTSHPFRFSIVNNKYLTWTFENILLPDSNNNEPQSHGYISYRIKPKSSIAESDTIRNSASIYFDYNLPVKTNTQLTIVRPPVPAVPVISGLTSNYCPNVGNVRGRIENPPVTGSSTTITVKLDATALPVAADSSFLINMATLGTGSHTITASFTNSGGSRSSTYNFTVNSLQVPDVNISSNITNVINLVNPVVITASNALAGGSAPLYTFGKNRGFTSLWQAESVEASLTISPPSLTVGENWVYVRMKSSATCVSAEFAYDSVKIVRDMSTGIIDPDNPGKIISVYPNPLTRQFFLKGLNPTRKYRVVITNLNGQVQQQTVVGNQASAGIVLKAGSAGSYLLSLYDDRKNKLIGTLMLVKQ